MYKTIQIFNSGILYCKCRCYNCAQSIKSCEKYVFKTGTNHLIGDIDSGVWGISYFMSMFKYDVNKKAFEHPLVAIVDGQKMSMDAFSETCCYLDERYYPLFKSKFLSVEKLIKRGLEKNDVKKTYTEIRDLFELDKYRLTKPVYCVGNERFRAMAAIGYAHGKKVFCFPWMSDTMVDYYKNNLLITLKGLKELQAITVIPTACKYTDVKKDSFLID